MIPLTFESIGPFEIAYCPGEKALEYLTHYRSEGKRAGFTTIMMGGKEDAEMLAEDREFGGASSEDSLATASTIDVDNWLSERAGEYEPEIGDWPDQAPTPGSIGVHLEILSGKPKKEVAIVKIPTPRNWEAPAFVGMGGWNECPDAAVITAFAKRWFERYGAEIVSITHDVMEFTITRPPADRDLALTLAREQYLFCSDIVDQGVGEISALAATLLHSNYWYFWWD